MKVAILIPTMNRPDFIERTLSYYDSLKSLHPVYIGDASASEISARTVASLERFRNVEVKYFHWEGMGANQAIVKLAESAQAVCRYCAFHGDDDYFIPTSLSQCAEFLSRNEGYRTVQGRAASFSLDRPGPYGEIQLLGDYWGINALEQERSVERLASFQRNYFVTQFSTHRTEEFIEDSGHFRELRDHLVGELLHCFTFAIKGKSKFLDCLYLIRNVHEGIYHPDFFDWIVQEYWASEFHKMRRALALALQETSDLPQNEAARVVYEALKLRLKPNTRREAGYGWARGFSAKLKSALPSYLKNAIRQFRQFTWSASDMRLLRSKNSMFYDEFLPVSSSLTKVATPTGGATLD